MNTKDADNLQRELFERSPVSQGPKPVSTFSENFNASFATFFDEEMSISRYIHRDVYEERNRVLDGMISRGEIDPTPYTTYAGNGIDYAKMAYDTKRKGVDVRDDYDVRDALREELKVKRQYAEDIHSRAGLAGAAGTFLGTTTGAMLDPINVGAMFITPPLALVRTGTALARAGKAALFYGSVTAGTESLIQATYVYDWKKHIGVEYSPGNALTNIAFAAVGSGAIGAVGEVGAYHINRGFKKLRENINNNAPEGERQKLLTEVDAAEREYNAHVKQFRIEQKRLQALADLENQPLPGETEAAPANYDREDFDEADFEYSYEEYQEEGMSEAEAEKAKLDRDVKWYEENKNKLEEIDDFNLDDYDEQRYEESNRKPDIELTEEDLRTDNIVDGDFETEEDFIRALEGDGPADNADIIDLETARANRNFENDIARAEQDFERQSIVLETADSLENDTDYLLNLLQTRKDYTDGSFDFLEEPRPDVPSVESERARRELEERKASINDEIDEVTENIKQWIFSFYRQAFDLDQRELFGLAGIIDSLDHDRIVDLSKRLQTKLQEPGVKEQILTRDELDGFKEEFDVELFSSILTDDEWNALLREFKADERRSEMTKVWDAQTDSVAARIEEVMRLEERILFEEDDMARFDTNDPEYDLPESRKETESAPEAETDAEPTEKASGVTGNPWEDFDEGEFLAMSQEERDAYLARVLGEDTNLDDIEVAEEIGVDANGDPLYQTRSRSEVNEEIDDMIDAIEEFKDCWDSPDE